MAARPDRRPLVQSTLEFRRRRSGDLEHDIALFAELLRSVGVPIPVLSMLHATQAAASVRVEVREDFRDALRCCLIASREEQSTFDIAFDLYFQSDQAESSEPAEKSGPGGRDTVDAGPATDPSEAVSGGLEQTAAAAVRRASYSKGGREHGELSTGHDEKYRIRQLAQRIARALGDSRSRRMRITRRGDLVDIRASFRHNVRFGAEILALRYVNPVRQRARLVVLCDVSSSMRPHAALFLTFAHELTKAARTVETAIFNVETAFVTDVFRRNSLSRALYWLRGRSVALAGGTRIGHCLNQFNTTMERAGTFRPDTTALLLSDGWDVGDAELLRRELGRLRRQVGRVIWLDPHAAETGYRPQVSGLRTALPFVDDYLDFSTVDSLSALTARLEMKSGSWKGAA